MLAIKKRNRRNDAFFIVLPIFYCTNKGRLFSAGTKDPNRPSVSASCSQTLPDFLSRFLNRKTVHELRRVFFLYLGGPSNCLYATAERCRYCWFTGLIA